MNRILLAVIVFTATNAWSQAHNMDNLRRRHYVDSMEQMLATARNNTAQAHLLNSISVSVVPQDIGRVILNLINNAFYAVKEKAISCKLLAIRYEPTVTILTGSIQPL